MQLGFLKKIKFLAFLVLLVLIFSVLAGLFFAFQGFKNSLDSGFFFSEEEAVIEAIDESSPAVVSIVATKDLPIFEQIFIDPFEEFFGESSGFLVPRLQQKGFEKTEVSAGTGFLISSDGLILTNKHVIDVAGAEFTVILNEGKKFKAEIAAKDPVLDLALIKIDGQNLHFLKMGDSDKLRVGQTVIAIGNALGEFRNTVSRGVISGLSRSIVASSGNTSQELSEVIQTDAAINKGNSGGPLLNLKGEVIGINTAIVLGAQNIGFAIPINQTRNLIGQQ
mgnify:CR=1 FL=1